MFILYNDFKTKLVVVNHVSNALGLINPIKEIIDKAHEFGSKVLIDGAQSAAHFKTDLQLLDIDFYVTSAHKLCGPTGVGFLYGKESLLNELPPFQGGGEMISDVTFQKTTYVNTYGHYSLLKVCKFSTHPAYRQVFFRKESQRGPEQHSLNQNAELNDLVDQQYITR